MRGRPGQPVVTDGPYAEAREVIGGLFVIDAASYDEAVALCGDCPHPDFGAIEISLKAYGRSLAPRPAIE